MNYIRHLNSFYEKLAGDSRLNPHHVSLYLALFQCWNMNLFQNPISVNRSQVLNLCKIGSHHTYYNVLKDLCDWGYIRYEPSYTRSKGSLIHLCIFAPIPSENVTGIDSDRCKNATVIGAEMHPDRCINATTIAANMHPSINNINNKLYCGGNSITENSNFESSELVLQPILNSEKSKRKKIPPKKEKVMELPSLEQVKTFFKLESYPELEAHKFFNHFQSNGWKVGGKSPMKDWNAAARNWMLNYQKFNPGKPGSRNLNLNNTKNYGEPL